MKITPLRMVALSAATFAFVSVGSSQASAADIRISVGAPPPPVVVEHPWARPYRTAVWIPGHHEWINGRWVWIGGYYTYPPHHHSHWTQDHYSHGYYYPGRWE